LNNKVSEIVYHAIKNDVENLGFSIWDVEYKSGSNAMLTIFIDKPEYDQYISMDEIAQATDVISEKLDQIEPDPFDDTYMLDVASPGVYRTLTTPEHYQWALDKQVIVGLFKKINDSKQIPGKLTGFDEQGIQLDGEINIGFDQITKIQMNEEI
jgi:ribosome maturation factor RimP